MKSILKYIFSLFLVLIFSFQLLAQDTVEKKEPWKLTGIKAGLDVGRFSSYLFKPEQTSYAGSIDIGFNNKRFFVGEFGYSEINLDKENYNYNSTGKFYKLGFDYNMLKKYPTDFLGAGLRVGYSSLEHSANGILINSSHWGNYYFEQESETNQSVWLEASFGIKGEIFKNIYLGWSAIIKVKFYGGKDDNFQPYDIPGYGNAAKSINFGANYFIYYQIPFNRN